MNVIAYSFYRHANSAYESERAGAGRGVFFCNYIRAIVRGHWAVYPDWSLWLYHDNRVREYSYWPVMERMHERGLLKLIPMGEATKLCGAMCWRLLPIWNLSVKRVLCRDVDSLSTPRERRAIEKWIASDRAISALHDSESHSSTALMGGMVGFKADWMLDRFSSWASFMALADQFGIDMNQHGADQRLLNAAILPHAGGQIAYEDRTTLGAKDSYIDQLTNHIGGAYHVDPLVGWFSRNRGHCPKLAEIEECEKGWAGVESNERISRI